MSLDAVQSGFHLGLGRILRARPLVIGAAIVGFAAASALAERKLELLGSATRALEGAAFGFLIPISSFAAVGAMLGNRRLDDAATPLARLGASRRATALGLVVSAMLATGALAALIALSAAVLAHDPWAPPLAHDALASTWIGALTGSAYGAIFALGSTFGQRGGGRNIALFCDFLLGGSFGWLSLFTPRAHAFNLLGAPPPLDGMGQWLSVAGLVAVALVSSAWASLRCAR